jgi:hypothetical protein
MTKDYSHNSNNLSALYYPETICLNEQELKYLLLLYDKIYFLPIDIQLNLGHTKLSKRFSIHDGTLTGAFRTKKEAHYTLMYMSEPEIWDDYMKKIMDIYDELEEKNILIGLKDEKYERASAWHPLQEAVKEDMNDNNFVSACNKYRNEKIFIPSTDGAVIKGGGFMTRPSAYKGDYALPSICSERLNSTLHFADRERLFPVSPYRMYVDLLNSKLRRIAVNKLKTSTSFSETPTNLHKFSILSWELITEVVPLHAINQKNSNEILRYKSACGELKERFHDYLFTLEATINNEPWDEKFSKEINQLVKKQILPEIQSIRDKKVVIWEKLFGEIVKSLSSLKVLPPLIGLHMIPGFSFLDILTMSTAIVGAATLPNFIDAWQTEKQLRRNALFFIVNFNRN